MDESTRRRNKQLGFNKDHGITPKSVERKIDVAFSYLDKKEEEYPLSKVAEPVPSQYTSDTERLIGNTSKRGKNRIKELEKEMTAAAKNLDFEKAARIRDIITELKGPHESGKRS